MGELDCTGLLWASFRGLGVPLGMCFRNKGLRKLPRVVCVLGQTEYLWLCPLRSKIVVVNTLRTRNAWIYLTCLDLEHQLGQNQLPQKGCWQKWFPLGWRWEILVKTGPEAKACGPNVRSQPWRFYGCFWSWCIYYPSVSPVLLSSQHSMVGNVWVLSSEVRWRLCMWRQLEFKWVLGKYWKSFRLPCRLPLS